jgi:hypothetical protein
VVLAFHGDSELLAPIVGRLAVVRSAMLGDEVGGPLGELYTGHETCGPMACAGAGASLLAANRER